MQEFRAHGGCQIKVSPQAALASMLFRERLVKDHSFMNLPTQIILILVEHVIKGVLSSLRQVAGLQDALVAIHLEVGLLLTDHGFEECGHAWLFLKSLDCFFFLVCAWTYSLPSALDWDVVDGAMVEALVLTEGAPP